MLVECTAVTKSFRRNLNSQLLRHHVSSWFKRGAGEKFVALQDVSFGIERGESLGIIGPMELEKALY